MSTLETLVVGPPTQSGAASESLQAECGRVLLESLLAVTGNTVSRWASTALPADLALAQDFLAAVYVIRGAPENLRHTLFQHPSFCYWLKGLRRVSRGDDPINERRLMEVGPGLAWPIELATGALSRTWRTRADDRGGLRLPLWHCYLEFGAVRSEQTVTVEGRGENVRFCWDDGSVQTIAAAAIVGPGPQRQTWEGVSVLEAPRLAGTEVACSARDPFLRADLTGTNQRDTGVNFFGTRDGIYLDQPNLSTYETALKALEVVWPEQFADLPRFTKIVIPMRNEGPTCRAFTVSSRQGAIFLDQIPAEPLVENFIHENAHVKLRQIELLGQLLMDPQQSEPRFPVPWRPDPRPIPGIVEGLWVFSHIAEYRLRLWKRLGDDGLRERLVQLLHHLQAARDIVKAHARFTERGEAYLDGVRSWIDDLQRRAG